MSLKSDMESGSDWFPVGSKAKRLDTVTCEKKSEILLVSRITVYQVPLGTVHTIPHSMELPYSISKKIADLPSIGDIKSVFCRALATSALFHSHPFMFFALFPRDLFCLPKLLHWKIPSVLPYLFQHENLKTATGVQHRKCVLCDSAARST